MSERGDHSVSALTSLSRTENIEYFMTVIGLDRTAASFLYRAEKLQDKGQWKAAMKYYQKVLEIKPDCSEAQMGVSISTDMLVQEEQEGLSDKVTAAAAKPKDGTAVIVSEMEILWNGKESIQFDYNPDPDDLAFDFAKRHLSKSGHSGSLLKLLKNSILEEKCDVDTGWEMFMSGRALFQVTLIPDRPESPLSFSSSRISSDLTRKMQKDASLASLFAAHPIVDAVPQQQQDNGNQQTFPFTSPSQEPTTPSQKFGDAD